MLRHGPLGLFSRHWTFPPFKLAVLRFIPTAKHTPHPSRRRRRYPHRPHPPATVMHHGTLYRDSDWNWNDNWDFEFDKDSRGDLFSSYCPVIYRRASSDRWAGSETICGRSARKSTIIPCDAFLEQFLPISAIPAKDLERLRSLGYTSLLRKDKRANIVRAPLPRHRLFN